MDIPPREPAKVKRYRIYGEDGGTATDAWEYDDGPRVKYDDYAALVAQRDDLKRVIERIESKCFGVPIGAPCRPLASAIEKEAREALARAGAGHG